MEKNKRPQNSVYYLSILTNAKDSLYHSVIEVYDNYLYLHPRDVAICIEKCKVMEMAYYEESEDYNPNYEQCTSYLDSLVSVFPDEPELLIYKSGYEYGDSAITYCKRVLQKYNEDRDKWNGKEIWRIYEKLSNAYSSDEKPILSIKYGLLAMEENDSLDLSLQLAPQYQSLFQKQEAKDILIKHLDSTNSYWDLSQRGKLLLELGVFDKALKALKWASKDTNYTWADNSTLSQALINNGFIEQGRDYLIKELKNEWSHPKTFRKLFEFDMKYGSIDSAVVSYRRMADQNFLNDPVGIKRLRLFFKSPLIFWSVGDILRLGLLFIGLLILFLLPYLWILPIYSIGNYFKNKGKIFSQTEFRWTLRHFWITSGLLILADIIANLLFYHDNFFENGGVDETTGVDITLANMTLFSFGSCLLSAISVIKLSDLKFIWGNIRSKASAIGVGIGYSLLLRLGLGIFVAIYKYSGVFKADTESTSSIVDNIKAVNEFYHPLLGFAIVVIIVPIYEEIIFRGVFLTASEKYMKFFWANTLQATLFALAHFEWRLIPFYMAFALIAGYQKRKTESLATGIVMHITNNLIAFIVIMNSGPLSPNF